MVSTLIYLNYFTFSFRKKKEEEIIHNIYHPVKKHEKQEKKQKCKKIVKIKSQPVKPVSAHKQPSNHGRAGKARDN
jgi:hypothetical protein